MTYHCGECGLEGGAYDAVFDELQMTKIALDEARAELIDEHARPPGAWDRLIVRAEKAESCLTTIQTMCDAAVEKKLRQRVPPFGAVVTVERLLAVLRSTA